jgi:hypothetical protein
MDYPESDSDEGEENERSISAVSIFICIGTARGNKSMIQFWYEFAST